MSSQAQAVILLTVPFGKTDAKPLSVREWGRFALWLKDHELEPSRLLTGDPQSLLSGWMDRTVTLQRIEGLLDRGGALGLALEKWQRAGLWIVTRSEPDYPERLKRRLRCASTLLRYSLVAATKRFSTKAASRWWDPVMPTKQTADREQIASDPSAFSGWLSGLPEARHRQLIHILPHLLFPDTFERISSEGDKRLILAGFGDTPEKEIRKWSTVEIDRALFKLRRRLEEPSRGLLELQRHRLSAFSPLIVVARSAASVSQVHLEGIQRRRDDALR